MLCLFKVMGCLGFPTTIPCRELPQFGGELVRESGAPFLATLGNDPGYAAELRILQNSPAWMASLLRVGYHDLRNHFQAARMTDEQDEVARFKDALHKSSLERIRQGLDDFVIVRGWKRKLAEEEPARRQRLQDAQDGQESKRTRSQARYVWALMLALILAAMLGITWNVLGR